MEGLGMVGAVALGLLFVTAAALIVFGVFVCAGVGVASIVAGVLTAGLGVLFLADWPGGSGDK